MTDGPTVAALRVPSDSPTELEIERIGDSAMVRLTFEDDNESHSWELLPKDLGDAIDRAIGRLPRAEALSIDREQEQSTPFDLHPTVTLRTTPPGMDVREEIAGMARRARAVKAFEEGKPIFDIHVALRVFGAGAMVEATIIGVPGNEVTLSTMKMAVDMLTACGEEILRRQDAGIL